MENNDRRSSARIENHKIRGENNGMSKLSNNDVILMFDFYNSCNDEVEEIDKKIIELKKRRLKIKSQMTRKNIANMFDISTTHCERILKGESRLELLRV